eukprot:GEMP01031340.1.p1 GENE.GEMP01031340.1~~GEMP01031340.1.p1  ORF type:complete len:204 (+),score=35.00 GEMP01031340.1:34-645(+)
MSAAVAATPLSEEAAGGKSLQFQRTKITEKSALHSAEKIFGYTWDQLHSYKEMMALPQLPVSMARELIPRKIVTCGVEFQGLDRCMEQLILHQRDNYPYERLQICKPTWIQFNKCVTRRDMRVIRYVTKWESKHYDRMLPETQQEYLEDLARRAKYQDYASINTHCPLKKLLHTRDAIHIQTRIRNLSLPNEESEEDGSARSI